MLKFFVADQCTKRHNKNSQSTCLDVLDKNLYALTYESLTKTRAPPALVPPSWLLPGNSSRTPQVQEQVRINGKKG